MEYAIDVMKVKKKAWSCNWSAQNCTLPSIVMPCLRIVGAKLRKDYIKIVYIVIL